MKPKICLNMIVRNEAHIITETLDSVCPFIDCWQIVDTGSEDETPQLIKSYFDSRGIEGVLHFDQWVDFGANRTRALKLCEGKAEYAWVVDADDLVVGSPDFSALNKDAHSLLYGPDFCYWRKQIFRTAVPWQYVGVVHEYPTCAVPSSHARLKGDYHIVSRRLGNRNQNPGKYQRDIELLSADLQKNPGSRRSVFYLAQSYYDNKDTEQALHWYRKRSEMGGWEEEVFYSKLRIGQCMEALGEPFADVQAAYLDCWEYRPIRAEPLYHLSRLCRELGRYSSGYLFAGKGKGISYPENDQLFIDTGVYSWKMTDELSIHAYYVDQFVESALHCRQLLDHAATPLDQMDRIRRNLSLAENRMAKISSV